MTSDQQKMIISGETMNVQTDFKYSKVKLNSSGGKSVNILNAQTNTTLFVSTPLMLTWGVNEIVDKKTNEVKGYSLSLQFPGEEYKTPAITRFYDNMKKLEDRIKADAITNAKEWFGKANMTSEVINAIFNPMLYYSKNEKTGEPDYTKNPTLKVKVPFYDGQFKDIELYDMNSNLIYPDEHSPATPKDLIAKGTNIAVVMQCGGLWFAGGSFGILWRLFQAVVKPKPTLKGKCHIHLNIEDKQRLTSQSIEDPVEEEDIPLPTASDVPDSDEEEAPKPVVKKEEVAAPAVVKKKIVKKTA